MAAIRPFANFRERPRCRRDEDRQQVDDPGDGKQENHPKYPPGWVVMTWQAPLMCSAEPPMPFALCFRLRPAEDPFDRANQQTAVRDCTMDLLAYGTVCCAVHDRQEAAPEDEPEVKHELGGREHP
ncbi:hypothetical protein NW757_008667 [Fusarium falciforme]|nr:hypothetical protein NW757_008667 [Fusarium falciforme]